MEHCFPDREKYTRSADGSIIEELRESYPDLQVSVPVHAEEWDPETYAPVCFIPSDYVDMETPSIEGFDTQGNSVTVDALNEPNDPVTVVGLNERSGIMVGGSGRLQPVKHPKKLR